MKKTNQTRSSIQKVRRVVSGSKRADGWELQKSNRQVHRPDPSWLRWGKPDSSLTSVAGLVPFGSHLRDIGVDRELRQAFTSST